MAENPWTAFTLSCLSTSISEIGDRSFFTATVLAIRYNRWIVFFATWTALASQSLSSSLAGAFLNKALSQLGKTIPWTEIFSAIAFAFFSLQYLKDALHKRERAPSSVLTPIRTPHLEELSLATPFVPSVDGADPRSPRGLPREGRSPRDTLSLHHNPQDSPSNQSRDARSLFIDTTFGGEADGGLSDARRPFVADRIELRAEPNSPHSSLPPTLLAVSSQQSTRTVCTRDDYHPLVSPRDLEHGPLPRGPSKSAKSKKMVFWKVFTIIYLAEVGDTSMLTTATLASDRDPWMVFLGALVANAIVNGCGIAAGSWGAKYIDEKFTNVAAALIFGGYSILSVLSVSVKLHGM